MNLFIKPRPRLARIAISPDVLVHSLRSGFQVTSGLPVDAKVRWSWFECERQILWVVCESASFEELMEGEHIPEIYPAIQSVEVACPLS